MTQSGQPTVHQLFRDWRNGDAVAGQTMAQQFTDWYYAITAVRLGDHQGRPRLEAACAAFTEGIMKMPRPGDLIEWAHAIVQRELEKDGRWIRGGDFPNALTEHRSPTMLLREVQASLSLEERQLLGQTYDADCPLEQVIESAEANGGWPYAVLQARYALKRVLAGRVGVPFQEVPDQPDLDLGPVPLYEAARMASPDEEAQFERWLITSPKLCRDVAEFATFAHALRAGALKNEPEPAPEPVAPNAPTHAPTTPTPARRGLSGNASAIIALVVGLILVGLIALLSIL